MQDLHLRAKFQWELLFRSVFQISMVTINFLPFVRTVAVKPMSFWISLVCPLSAKSCRIMDHWIVSSLP